MYVVIGLNTFTDVRYLSFAPETDVIATSIPVNEFQVEIAADTSMVDYGMSAELYDDMDTLWASYSVVKVDDIGSGYVRVLAQSLIQRLEYRTMASEMYVAKPVFLIMQELFEDIPGAYRLDATYGEQTGYAVSGFCPEQSARERLTWVLFAIGAYVKTFFTDKIDILPVPNASTLIPLEKTFWRPSITVGEYVTGIKITSYMFSRAASEEVWENDENSYIFPLPWVAETQDFTIVNPNAPQDAPENVIEITDLYLINVFNVSAILTRLSSYYFNSTTVSLDCINNAEFEPGSLVYGYISTNALISGRVKSAAFRFGKQARSTLEIIAAQTVEGAELVINYTFNSVVIKTASYYLPIGYAYSIQNPYIDKTVDDVRRVYRPLTDYVTGTMSSGGASVGVAYEAALILSDGVLQVLSVDGATQSDGAVSIA